MGKPSEITVVSSFRATHQLVHQEALCKGLAKIGIPAKKSFSAEHVGTEYVACWGWRNGKLLRERGKEVIIMERGYLGDRFAYTSLGWNGLNGHAFFPHYPDDGGRRFADHGGEIKPWKEDGDYALILGQVPGDASLRGQNLLPWYTRMAEEIRALYQIPVYFRQHPDLTRKGVVQRVPGTVKSRGTLQEALSGALFSVCYNSNAAVDSVLAGTPCIVGDDGSMAYSMCAKSLAQIMRPDRAAWAHGLAWRQWSIEEMESGEALRGLF